MLLFNEMDPLNKIKIYNKYAEYPKISQFDSSYFSQKAKIYEGKNIIPKVKLNDPLKLNLRVLTFVVVQIVIIIESIYKQKFPFS